MSAPANRRLARRIYKVAGLLMRVQTPQRTYEWLNPGFRLVGWRFLPSVTGLRLLELAEGMDPEHFDHWALVHPEDEPGAICLRCGGWMHQSEIERNSGVWTS